MFEKTGNANVVKLFYFQLDYITSYSHSLSLFLNEYAFYFSWSEFEGEKDDNKNISLIRES